MKPKTEQLRKKKRRRQPVRKTVKEIAEKHAGCTAVTSTKDCYSLKIDTDYPNAMAAAIDLAQNLHKKQGLDHVELPEYRIETDYGQGWKAVKINFPPYKNKR